MTHVPSMDHAKREGVMHRIVKRQDQGGVPNPKAGEASSSSAAASSPSQAPSATTTTAAPTSSSAPATTTTTTQAATTTTTQAPVTTSTTTEAPYTTTTTETPYTTTTTTTAAPTTSSSTSADIVSTLSTTTPPQITSTITSTSGPSSTTTISLPTLANANSKASSGPSAGTVVGIVAGALVGVVVLSALVGYLFRRYCSRRDDYDDPSPFDRDEFKRESVMLDDRDDYYANMDAHGARGHSPQMSQYSIDQSGLQRSNTGTLPGLARGNTLNAPRPPSALASHYQQQQQHLPSFLPGQVVPAAAGAYDPDYAGHDMYSYPPDQHQYGGAYPEGAGDLHRNASNGSTYSVQTNYAQPAIGRADKRLSRVAEDYVAETGSRSGTPTNANVQQSYFSHGRDDSTSMFGVSGSVPSVMSQPRGADHDYGNPAAGTRARADDWRSRRDQRTLSVRNAGDPYAAHA